MSCPRSPGQGAGRTAILAKPPDSWPQPAAIVSIKMQKSEAGGVELAELSNRLRSLIAHLRTGPPVDSPALRQIQASAETLVSLSFDPQCLDDLSCLQGPTSRL